jgi:hypothetical protein
VLLFMHFFKKNMRSINKLIKSQHSLAQLNRQLAQQESLTHQVKALLPAPLDEQLLRAVINGRTLSLLVHSPVWASRLRYLAPQLLRQLRQQGLTLEQLRPRIVQEQGMERRNRRHRPKNLSAENAKLLRQTADALDKGPLREALRRLSRHQE